VLGGTFRASIIMFVASGVPPLGTLCMVSVAAEVVTFATVTFLVVV